MTRSRPLVSVVVPVYNVEAYIDACLASIRGQTYSHLDIVLVEDGSTDGTVARLDAHLADGRVRMICHATNGGLSKARNTGIEAARGEYVLFVDSDDIISEGLVEACVDAATATGADVVAFDCLPFQNAYPVDLEPQAPSRLEPIEGAGFFELPQFAWLKLIRADLLTDPALRFPEGYYYEDGPFHWALGLQAETAVHLRAPLYGYRQRGTSITGSAGRQLLDQFHALRLTGKALARHPEVPGAAERLAAHAYGTLWSVLTRIDDPLLGEAIDEARAYASSTRPLLRTHRLPLKTRVLALLLALPRPLARHGVRALRATLETLSPARRAQSQARHDAPEYAGGRSLHVSPRLASSEPSHA